MNNGLLTLFMVLSATAIMLLMLRRHQNRIEARREPSREKLDRLREAPAARDTMSELIVELEQCARRVSAEVETRFVKLETVIRDADERIARLQAELRRGAHAPAVAPPESVAWGTAAQSDAAEPDSVRRPPSESATLRDSMAADEPDAGAGAFREEVYALADQGRRPIEIAERLGALLGEVELVLNLRQWRERE